MTVIASCVTNSKLIVCFIGKRRLLVAELNSNVYEGRSSRVFCWGRGSVCIASGIGIKTNILPTRKRGISQEEGTGDEVVWGL